VVHWSSSLMIVSRSYSICKQKFNIIHHHSTQYSLSRGDEYESVVVVVPLLKKDIYLMSQSIWEWEWNETVCQCHVIARSLIFVSFWIDRLMQSDAIGIAVVAVLYVGVA